MKNETEEVASKARKVIERVVIQIHEQVDSDIWKIVDRQTYKDQEEREITFQVARNAFWTKFEVYWDPRERAARVREIIPNMKPQNLKEILELFFSRQLNY